MKRFYSDYAGGDGNHLHRRSGRKRFLPLLNSREVQKLAGVGDCHLAAALAAAPLQLGVPDDGMYTEPVMPLSVS